MLSNSGFLTLSARGYRTRAVVGISSAALAMIAGIGGVAPRVARAQIIVLASLNGQGATGTGNGPTGVVTFDSAGNLYGTATTGGLDNDGTVWEIPAAGAGYGTATTVASFTGSTPPENGNGPGNNVIFDSAGNMYGTAGGGATNDGLVWEMSKTAGGAYGPITDLASFISVAGNSSTGIYPSGIIVSDSAGNLYGTTTEGGSTGGTGTVWELAKGASAITAVASFSDSNGSSSLSGVTFDSAGNMFGTSHEGGANSYGTVWEIVKGSGAVTDLASFTGAGAGNNGSSPANGSVIMDAKGNLYGTSFLGGTSNRGTVWEITKTGSTFGTLQTLANFSYATGDEPNGATMDSAGNIFGTTGSGGASGYGTIWELAAGSGTITDLAAFNASNGSLADNSVSIDSAGNLYGTAADGGANADGTVWEIKGVATESSAGAASAPEPAALAMLLPGLTFAAALARRRSRRKAQDQPRDFSAS